MHQNYKRSMICPFFFSLSLSLSIFIEQYIYIYVCVCVCFVIVGLFFSIVRCRIGLWLVAVGGWEEKQRDETTIYPRTTYSGYWTTCLAY